MIEDTATIDIIAHDAPSDEVVLVMHETRPWSGSDQQLFQLQEKLNTYVSFILDGEMAESYPQFVGKNVRLQLDSPTMPDERTLEFLQAVYDQLALQAIRFELRIPEGAAGLGGESCGTAAAATGNGVVSAETS